MSPPCGLTPLNYTGLTARAGWCLLSTNQWSQVSAPASAGCWRRSRVAHGSAAAPRRSPQGDAGAAVLRFILVPNKGRGKAALGGTALLRTSPSSRSDALHTESRCSLPRHGHLGEEKQPRHAKRSWQSSPRAPRHPPAPRWVSQAPSTRQSCRRCLTSPGSQSTGPGTAAAPWGSCRCRAGGAAPGSACRAAAAGSTAPSWPAPETWGGQGVGR